MPAPNLSVDQVQAVLPAASEIEFVAFGGQKTVFKARIENQYYAMKFQSTQTPVTSHPEVIVQNDVAIRAQRETDTMGQCDSQYLVKMGPIGLQEVTIANEEIIYYSEEYIEGKDLVKYYKENGNFSVDELLQLGNNVSEAVKEIWKLSKIHRDIKPGNIIKRDGSEDFVLLDMGLLFDLDDVSLSLCPVGTIPYFSPEQLDFRNRRTALNFRSDLFSLGVVLYEMATGHHPFINKPQITAGEVCENLQKLKPTPPISLREELPPKLNDIIMRLLAKRSALRFRTIEKFQDALRSVE